MEDITSKWGGEQTVSGPCLVIPYTEMAVEDKKEVTVVRNLLLLPEQLDVGSNVVVEKRKRGIYDASVYNSDLTLSGGFDLSLLDKMNISSERIRWNDVRVIVGLSDLKGIREKVTMECNGEKFYFESGLPVENLSPGSGIGAVTTVTGKAMVTHEHNQKSYELFRVGLNAKPDLSPENLLAEGIMPFKVLLKMRGSQGLYLIPVGKTTTMKMQSNWATPSFDGEFLPVEREIDEQGFTAGWKVLDLNRSYGQAIRVDNSMAMNLMASSRYGVRFIQPVDQYQQNLRSVKYAVLIILLTFVTVFFIEVLQNKKVNPLQYILVGLALVLFYSLLLSMSEVWGFNLAYAIAAVMTIVLIMIHLTSILRSRREGLSVGALLVFLYLFVFVLIKMESFALLAGSLGLFVILAVIMHFSKRIKI